MCRRYRVQSAFTLIETLIFLALFAFISISIFRTMWSIIQLSESNKQFQLADMEMVRVGQRIDSLIRNAESVEETTEERLTLGIHGSPETDTLFLVGHSIVLERGGRRNVLTSSRVYIDKLSFFEAAAADHPARFVGYEINGHKETSWKNFPLMIRGGAMVKSLINQ